MPMYFDILIACLTSRTSLANGTIFKHFYYLLTHSHHSLFLSGTTRQSSLFLHFSCLSPGISHLSNKPWLVFVEKICLGHSINILALNMFVAFWISLFWDLSGHKYKTFLYNHMFFYLYWIVYLYILKTTISYQHLQLKPGTMRVHSGFHSFHICGLFLFWLWETDSHYPLRINLFDWFSVCKQSCITRHLPS